MSASTTFCPSCGAEYLVGVAECADCHVPLGAAPIEGAASTGAGAGADGDEIVYDLAEWSHQDRNQLELLLTGEGILHRWEVVTDLVVREADADRAETMMDEIEGVSGVAPLPASDDDDDGDDELTYAVMSDLFVAADKLQKDPADAATAGDYFVAADAVAVTPPPFGIDRSQWQQIQEFAASLANALESDADDDVIGRDAGSLRSMLARYV